MVDRRSTQTISTHAPSPKSCNYGSECTFILMGKCKFHHTNDEIEWGKLERSRRSNPFPCKEKGKCIHLAAGNCNYLHTKAEHDSALKNRKGFEPVGGLCIKGRDCWFLKAGKCEYQHTEEDKKWAASQSRGRSSNVLQEQTVGTSLTCLVQSTTLGMKQINIDNESEKLSKIKDLIARKYEIDVNQFELRIRNEILEGKLDRTFGSVDYRNETPFKITQKSASGSLYWHVRYSIDA